MLTKRQILSIGGFIILLGQLIYFSDYISPFHWGYLKVSGMSCTCPNEDVLGGQLYLRSITPDSLKQFDLNYSEIYVTERPSTDIDPMGADKYIIEGKVIGKDRVSENDSWHPKLRVDKWREINILKDWGVKFLFSLQLILWLLFAIKNTHKT